MYEEITTYQVSIHRKGLRAVGLGGRDSEQSNRLVCLFNGLDLAPGGRENERIRSGAMTGHQGISIGELKRARIFFARQSLVAISQFYVKWQNLGA